MTNLRLLKALQISGVPENILCVANGLYRVRSQSKAGSCAVKLDGTSWSCECADWRENRNSCKHVFAVVQYLAACAGHPLSVSPEPQRTVRRTYSQDWPSYDAAQQAEHLLFDPLLVDLLGVLPEKARRGKRGRPAQSLRTQLFCGVRKVYSQESSRRARGLLLTTVATGHGTLATVPSYVTPSRVFNQPTTSVLLLDLIHLSALPFIPLEDKGAVAIDSTGFCTTCRGAYCTERHDPGRTHSWVKAHLSVGTKTHALVNVQLTDEHGADSPQFLPMLEELKDAGFTFLEVTADKAYLSRDNYQGAADLGFDPYIPFKVDSTASAQGYKIWREKYHQFQLHREEFDAHYHDRSNVESAISAIKRKLGEPLLSKNSVARLNELLAKLLAYNITVLIHEMYEHGIDPGIPGAGMPSPPQTGRTEEVPLALPTPLSRVTPPVALPGPSTPPVIQN